MGVAATTLPPDVLARFRCPECGGPVTNADGLECERGHITEIRDGYVDAFTSPSDSLTVRTLASFGYEHTTFTERRREEEAYWRYLFDGVPMNEMQDGVGLDAACGSGRFAGFLARNMRALVALDGSPAVRTAARNLAEHANATVVRSDLRAIPFAPGSFDFITCIGVLHCLDRPADVFGSLARLLAPGGRILIFVYSRPTPGTIRSLVVRASAGLRRMTVHLPYRPLRALSAAVAAPLYACVVLPGRAGERLGVRWLSALPLEFYRGLPFRSLWLSTFDVLSAPLERRYAWPEIEPWFRDSGLQVESVRDRHGLVVLARRPA